jgi:hypothetical protein
MHNTKLVLFAVKPIRISTEGDMEIYWTQRAFALSKRGCSEHAAKFIAEDHENFSGLIQIS